VMPMTVLLARAVLARDQPVSPNTPSRSPGQPTVYGR
jgi:hypothetical protein